MAMQQQTWSLSGLATELDIDRRTLAKRLADLPPAEIREYASRTEKRWHLADVVAHLQNPMDALGEDAIQGFKNIISQTFFPAIISSRSFGAIIANGLQDELGLTEAQGMRAFQLAGVALSFALCEVLDDDDLDFQVPDFIVEMHELGIDGYLKKHSQTT